MAPRPVDPRRPSRLRWGALLALAAVGLLVWLLSSGGAAPAPLAAHASPATVLPAPAGWAAPPPPRPAPAHAALTSPPPRPAPPIIDEILVEKPEVCSGEENLITLRAHTPDGNDSHLHAKVGGGTGMRVPVRVWADEHGRYELPQVAVFSRDNVFTLASLPPYRVKPCQPERLVNVLWRRLPNAEQDFEFFVQVVELPVAGQPAPEPLVPVRYVWTFDEEAPMTTVTPLVTRTLRGGPHARGLYVQHLVRVDVFDAQGRRETGRTSLQLLDTAFENFDKKGLVTLQAEGTPRFPVLGEDGVVRQRFRLYHRFRGPVRIERVQALRAYRPRGDGPPPPEQVDAASLPVSEVPEVRGVEVEVALDTRAEPEVQALTYLLEGTSADGHPARGTFSIMRPPPQPTRENSQPVSDPVLVAKIKRARELLQQEFVTDEDLWRLEREGRFADLQVRATPASGPVAPPPPGASPGQPLMRSR